MHPKQVYRNQETRSLAFTFGIGFLLMAAFALFAPSAAPSSFGSRIAFALPLAVAGCAVIVRWGRQGIYVAEDGVEIRGAFSSRRLSWHDIRRFELRQQFRDLVCRIDLKDGTSVPARALNAGTGLSKRWNTRAQEQVEELNRLLAERQKKL